MTQTLVPAAGSLAVSLPRIAMAAEGDDFAQAAQIYTDCKQQVVAVTPYLRAAEPWSLHNSTVHDRHFTALRRLAELTK